LPDTAQKSEFLLEKGMVDCIVRRSNLKDKISFFIQFLMENPLLPTCIGLTKQSEKLDDFIFLSQKEREKNAIEITQ